uniref:DH domain-containing protein n=1 Tax=Rhabditophanes sp. KR3021 TaxID=114890 RepID=A0AC35TN96_9BILA
MNYWSGEYNLMNLHDRADNTDNVSTLSYQPDSTSMNDDDQTLQNNGLNVTYDDSENREKPKIVVFGKNTPDEEIIHILQNKFSYPVFISKNGHEFKDEHNVVFYTDDFSGIDFNYYNVNDKRILGPGVVRFHVREKTPLVIPREGRPKYCYNMQKHKICINFYPKSEVRQIVDLIHFMGGSAKREFTVNGILVTRQAKGSAYRLAVSVGGLILLPSWVKVCWDHRDDTDFDILDKNLIKAHTVPCFAGHKIFLCGFKEEDVEGMKEKIEKYEGNFVESYGECSHAIFVDNHVNFLNWPIISHNYSDKVYHVTAEWFWTSISVGSCAHEEAYSVLKKPLTTGIVSSRKRVNEGVRRSPCDFKKNMSHGSMDGTLDRTGSSGMSVDKMFSEEDINDVKVTSKQSKRYMVCMELLGTEENYVQCLRILEYDFKAEFEARNESGECIINAIQIKQIFSKVNGLLLVHTNILSCLKNEISNWHDNNAIGRIYSYEAEELKRVYRPYINNFDTACNTLNECSENEQFHVILKLIESRPELKRNSLKDLLIRPVQRMPSVVLLLKQLLAKTDRTNTDFVFLEHAIPKIETVVQETNSFLRETHDYTKSLEIFNDIEGLPAEIITSSRAVIDTLECCVVGASGSFWPEYVKKNIKIFFFNDIFVIAKIRSRYESKSNMDMSFKETKSLSRQASIANIFKRRPDKPYKYINYLLFPKIREVQFFSDSNCSGIFIIKMRLQLSDDLVIVKPLNETVPHLDPKSFFKQVAEHINKTSRQFEVEVICGEDIAQLERFNPEEAILIRKAIVQVSSANATSNMTSNRSSQFKRALTTVSLNFQSSLNRFGSKSTLNTIN